MAHVDVDGVSLHVQDVGSGPPVVLIAGFGLDHRLWDRQVRVLAELGHRVVCVDQRGHGASADPVGGYGLAQLVADLGAVLRQLEVGPATLVGHSFGGQVAFGLAVSSPDAVARLVLVGSNAVRASRSDEFPFGRPPGPMLAGLLRAEHEDRVASRVATIASGFATAPDPHVLDWLVGISLELPSWAAEACYRTMLESDQVPGIGAVLQPVLQVVGSDDPVHSAKGARWLNQQLADATLVEIKGCGHYPMLEAADAFDTELVAFVDS